MMGIEFASAIQPYYTIIPTSRHIITFKDVIRMNLLECVLRGQGQVRKASWELGIVLRDNKTSPHLDSGLSVL